MAKTIIQPTMTKRRHGTCGDPGFFPGGGGSMLLRQVPPPFVLAVALYQFHFGKSISAGTN